MFCTLLTPVYKFAQLARKNIFLLCYMRHEKDKRAEGRQQCWYGRCHQPRPCHCRWFILQVFWALQSDTVTCSITFNSKDPLRPAVLLSVKMLVAFLPFWTSKYDFFKLSYCARLFFFRSIKILKLVSITVRWLSEVGDGSHIFLFVSFLYILTWLLIACIDANYAIYLPLCLLSYII